MARGRNNDPVQRGGRRSFVVLAAALLLGSAGLVITTASPAGAAGPATTTTVTSSSTPSATGDAVTFTATITSPGTSVTTGVVQFSDGATNLGSLMPVDATGVATISTSALGEGTHQIFARYTDTALIFDQSVGSVIQQVDNATVVDGNTFCNEGAITIPSVDEATPYPSNITVSGLSGTISDVTVTLKNLSHEFPIDVNVLLAAPGGTKNLILMSDTGGNGEVSGLDVVFDDAAPGPVPSPITSGTFRPSDVTDLDEPGDGFPSPAPPLTGSTMLATFDGSLPNGTWSLYVVDDASGDRGSIAGGWCLTIRTPPETATSLTSDTNPSTFGDPVTFTATVTTGSTPVTNGTVNFYDGGTPLGDGTPLASDVALAADGKASFTTSSLTAGTHIIFATYPATAGLGSSAGALAQVVNQATTSSILASSLNPSTFGDSVTFTATVTTGSSPVTDGTVTFIDDSTPLATGVPLAADGTATFTISTLTVGSHTIAASYSGSASLAGSTATVAQVVNPLADAGGPYAVTEGATLTLDGSGSTAGATPAWDLNGDGSFTDASGLAPSLSWAALQALGINDGPSTHVVTMRVTLNGQTATATASLVVSNAPPTTVSTGALTATVGVPFTLKIGADDPSSADMASTFRYTLNWGDGSAVESVDGPADPPVTHTYGAAGTFSATFTATDKDGGTGAGTVVQVQVNPAPPNPTTPPEPITPPAPTTTTTPPAPTTTTPGPTVPPPVGPGGGLPPTGSDSSPLLLAAVVLTVAGLALLVGARRRRQMSP
jgi:subtilisin-like proprotein convertase family protein